MIRKVIGGFIAMYSELIPPLFAEERKEKIMQLLTENSKIMVPELCKVFGVSPVTIRTDLRDLETDGKLKRTHGGAIPVGKAAFESTSSIKEVEHIEEKKKIAFYAAQMVDDGDTIALDTGTTTLELAKCLTKKKDLTIVTNDLKIASYLETNLKDADIIVIGGILRPGFHCMVGPLAISSLIGLNVDKAFMATNAFSYNKGFTTPDVNQAELKKSLIEIASEIIMLVDSSKLGHVSFVKFASLTDIDKLITDSKISTKAANSLKELSDNLDLLIV
jgi:DeoR family transcriptional regulator, fructose operon transcriptional repressor